MSASFRSPGACNSAIFGARHAIRPGVAAGRVGLGDFDRKQIRLPRAFQIPFRNPFGTGIAGGLIRGSSPADRHRLFHFRADWR